jgi:hypothetical protein
MKQKADKEFTKPEDEIASLRRRLDALSNVSSPRAGTGGVNMEGGVILPPSSTPEQVKPITEQSETVPHNTSNSMGEGNSTTGVTQRGVEPSGSSPPRYVTLHERASQPTGLTPIRVDPNTAKSAIGPCVKSEAQWS